MNEGKVSVALLLSDLSEVKEISSIFKKLGVIPHFYEDLKTFWSGTLERLPALCIVDVKKMNEDGLLLQDHPAVIAEEMPLLFYYSDKTEPLLVSTHHFYHLGTLKKSPHYEGPLKAILKRLNKIVSLEQRLSTANIEIIARKEQVEKLELDLLESQRVDQYQSMVKSICVEFESLRSEVDFTKAVEKVFQGIDEIDEFAVLELSFNGQKLISPLAHAQKFRNIPSIWLGQVCSKGIELFAQNMGTQVAVDIMGGDLVSLLIKGTEEKPDKMIFVKSKNETFYNNFDWNLLEAYLNGFYVSYKTKLTSNFSVERKFSSAFSAMSFLDQFLFGQSVAEVEKNRALNGGAKVDYRLIDVDLTTLTQVILKKGAQRFFWERFEQEFINKLEIQSRVDFRFFDYGTQHLGFVVKAQDLDVFFDELKEFVGRFSYWKYFEDSESVLTQIIQPKVNMVPMSAHAYLMKALAGSQAMAETREQPKKAWSIVSPNQTLDV